MGGRTVVKNTGFLYFRMIVMLVIAFFTSRMLLKALGIEGYGIYNVVGGVVVMFASLRGAFSSSIQRFLNYEKGQGNHAQLQRIFSMGVNIQGVICLIFLVITETIGLWFLNHKLVIPHSQLYAANWVYQFSIVASLVTIMTIPQDAVIIANQKMDIYVYITLLEAVLKLAIIFALPLVSMDNLILYSLLVLCVSIVIRLITNGYCRYKFAECKYIFFWDKHLFKELGSFAGWNFLGNTAFSVTNEGSNIVLNYFGGPIANAARGITYQVMSAIGMFMLNIQIASSPHLIETYAQKRYEDFFNIFYSISKITFFIISILCIPLIVYTSYLLTLWLHTVPEYTASFTQLILYFLLIRVFHGPIDTIFKAVGNIKFYQIIDSATLLLTLPFSYILLKDGFSLRYVFISMIIWEGINLISIVILAVKLVNLKIIEYLEKVILPSIVVFSINFFIFYIVRLKFFSNNILVNIGTVGTSTVFCCFVIWLIGFSSKEKRFVKDFVYLKFGIKK